jgi:anti-anti-sigma factor
VATRGVFLIKGATDPPIGSTVRLRRRPGPWRVSSGSSRPRLELQTVGQLMVAERLLLGPSDYISVALHRTTEATLIEVCGELDLASVHHLEDCLSRALADDDGRPIHVDMAGVSFVDRTGFTPLIDAATALEDGRVLKVINASPRVRRLVALMGDVAIPIEPPSLTAAPASSTGLGVLLCGM